MEGIGALRYWAWHHLAGWLGRGSGSAWILAGTLTLAGGSAALLSPTPVHSRVVPGPSMSITRTAVSSNYTLPRHHCHGAEDGGY